MWQRLPCCLPIGSQSRKLCVVCNPPCRSRQINKWIFKYGEAYLSLPFPWCFLIRMETLVWLWMQILVSKHTTNFIPSLEPNICLASIYHWIKSHLMHINQTNNEKCLVGSSGFNSSALIMLLYTELWMEQILFMKSALDLLIPKQKYPNNYFLKQFFCH